MACPQTKHVFSIFAEESLKSVVCLHRKQQRRSAAPVLITPSAETGPSSAGPPFPSLWGREYILLFNKCLII